MKRSSLAARLLLWILPLTLSALFIISAATYWVARGAILAEVEEGVKGLAKVAAAEVHSFIEQRNNDLATIGQSPLFKDHYQNIEYGLSQEAEVYRLEIEKMLLAFSRRTQVYPQLRYLDASGRLICSVRDSRPGPTEIDKEDLEFFRRTRSLSPGQQQASQTRKVPWHPVPIVSYGVPLYDEAGKLRGALVFDSSMGPIYEMLGRLRIGHSGRSYITQRRAGVSNSELQRVGPLVTASVIVPGSPWLVLTIVRRSEFLERLQFISRATVLLGIVVALILTVVIILQVRLLLRPIQALSSAVKAYAAGDLDIQVAKEGTAETVSLAEAFNVMAGRLKRRTEDLVLRVRELTAMHRMHDAVLKRLGRSEIGASCLEAAVLGLGFERGLLYWVDEERGEIVGECAYADGSSMPIRDRSVPLGSSDMLAEVVRRRCAMTVENSPTDPWASFQPASAGKAHSFCLAPVIARGRVIAIMGVDLESPGGAATAPRMRSFSLFCGAASLAFENARLLDQIINSENRYRTAVENSPHAVVSLDQHLRVTLWNRRAEALFGYQPTEAFGRTLSFLFDEATYRILKRQVEVEGSLRLAEVSGRTRDGRALDLTLSWTGQAPSPSAAREWFVVIQDETEKKRLQSQLIQAEKMSAVGNLIAGVAHELNNPLTAVTGFAELLKDLPAKPEEQEDLRLLHVSALRCRDIVDGLLRFARKSTSERKRICLNDTARAALALSEYRLVKSEGLQLEVALDPKPPEVAGDPQRLQQVLINLLNNASDALKGRSGPRVIRVRTRAGMDSCEIEVEDTGPGVPPNQQKRIFDPFFTTKAMGLGTGLGLSISTQIVAEAGGTLSCSQGPEGGARFTARFPPCPEGVGQHVPTPTALPSPMPGRMVLIVDDEPDVVTLMARLVQEDGLTAVPAKDAEQALRLLGQRDFDLVITDVDLGRVRGTDLRQAALASGSSAAFLFVTGDVFNEQLLRKLEALGEPVLTKPFMRNDFLRQVRLALAQRAPSRKS
jgi:two-component system NtrC family sensor kinase